MRNRTAVSPHHRKVGLKSRASPTLLFGGLESWDFRIDFPGLGLEHYG